MVVHGQTSSTLLRSGHDCQMAKAERGTSGKTLALILKGDDTVGNPHRAQTYQFELFELCLLLKLDKQLPVEQFEASVSQSTVPSPPLTDPSDAFRCPGVIVPFRRDLKLEVVLEPETGNMYNWLLCCWYVW